MAFHVACPITCRRICFCSLGFPRNLKEAKSKDVFLQQVVRVEEFLKDPWGDRVSREGTVQVPVPKVVLPPTGDGDIEGDPAEEAAAASALAKRLALQRKAAAAMVAAEDYARRLESGDIVAASKTIDGQEQGHVNPNVMCRMCFMNENEGSERARRMLSCRSCGKNYHRSCLKSWAQHRDLFHWSSWTCPYCRVCEVCRSTGDPTRLMFCKRCDGAYHCYCQHPSHKNVTSGPYLCAKHTKCHSCDSSVPGNGLSVRWFLGYTCCDACGRLFVKGNYCPVCLKVYRDSESTPMVCCDVCQRWVHCQCDGISDEKYLQFQVDGNLQYKCATCRGECYQIKDLEDAVQELWRRRDKADLDLIASLRASVGLPTQEEIFSISPFSDDEENGPRLSKNDFGRSLKFSLKGLPDKSPKKVKEHGKKSSSKKYPKKKAHQESLASRGELHQSSEGDHDARSQGCSVDDDRINGTLSQRIGQDVSSRVAGICSTNQPGFLKHKCVDEVMVTDEDRTSRVVKIKSSNAHALDSGHDNEKHGGKTNNLKAKKLVINLGARKINMTNSPGLDSSGLHRQQESTSSYGAEDVNHQRADNKNILEKHETSFKSDDGFIVDQTWQARVLGMTGKGKNSCTRGKTRSEAPQSDSKVGRGNNADRLEASYDSAHVSSGKRSFDGGRVSDASAGDCPLLGGGKIIMGKHIEPRADSNAGTSEDHSHKPSLKFKFRNPNLENQYPHTCNYEKERCSVKGQRSKRKRPLHIIEKSSFNGDDAETAPSKQDSLVDEMMDASWILRKLGEDAIGKRVEVQQASDNSWHNGTVSHVLKGTPTLHVVFDDGRTNTLELGKQGVRFVLQKQKRSKI